MVQNRKRKRLHASLLVYFRHKKFKKLCFRKTLQRRALCMTTRSTMRSKNTEKSTRKIFQITFRRQIPGVNIKRIFYRDIHSETLVYLFCKFEQIFRRPSPKPAIYLTPRSTTLYFVMYFSLLALSFLFLSDRFRVLISFFSLEHFFSCSALQRENFGKSTRKEITRSVRSKIRNAAS